MAIAGKVAITLSTENGGAWSSNVTYDRLVAVKHNNNLYISRKTVANVEPPNDEFWFLALEGFSGDDIEDIINGTTQVGNAKTLDGRGAEYFAPLADLANYLPLTGGTMNLTSTVEMQRENEVIMRLKNTTSNGTGVLIPMQAAGVSGTAYLGASNGEPFARGVSGGGAILHTGNKPTGTYTGNGSATARTINTGGIGKVLAIWSSAGIVLATPIGSMLFADGISTFDANTTYNNGVLTVASTDLKLNASGRTYDYADL